MYEYIKYPVQDINSIQFLRRLKFKEFEIHSIRRQRKKNETELSLQLIKITINNTIIRLKIEKAGKPSTTCQIDVGSKLTLTCRVVNKRVINQHVHRQRIFADVVANPRRIIIEDRRSRAAHSSWIIDTPSSFLAALFIRAFARPETLFSARVNYTPRPTAPGIYRKLVLPVTYDPTKSRIQNGRDPSPNP